MVVESAPHNRPRSPRYCWVTAPRGRLRRFPRVMGRIMRRVGWVDVTEVKVHGWRRAQAQEGR